MRRGKPLGRKQGNRPEQRRFLIYCEGECTETQYFKGLKAELRALPVELCMGGVHGEPKSLAQAAIEHQARAPRSAKDRYTAYDEVWCVVDVEAPVPHPGLADALRLARGGAVNVALSNPCFEIWILLHFKDITAYLTSGQAQRLLENEPGCAGYSTARKHLDYASLRALHGVAQSRAQRLRSRAEAESEGNPRAVNPRTVNPWTDVDVLVEALRDARNGRAGKR
ncbi:RloB family protein [Streptomyces sp. NPDC001922]|uniref:RloB family protein n=1 Tax=Streptomyces sp. NPDC001922 TaxID=3364624 RepID=UPI003696A309